MCDDAYEDDGIQEFDFGGQARAHAVAIEDDGGIVVVGETLADTAIAVAREYRVPMTEAYALDKAGRVALAGYTGPAVAVVLDRLRAVAAIRRIKDTPSSPTRMTKRMIFRSRNCC